MSGGQPKVSELQPLETWAPSIACEQPQLGGKGGRKGGWVGPLEESAGSPAILQAVKEEVSWRSETETDLSRNSGGRGHGREHEEGQVGRLKGM